MIDYSQLPGQMIQTMLLIAYVRLGEPKGERGFFDWVIELMNEAIETEKELLRREREAARDTP